MALIGSVLMMIVLGFMVGLGFRLSARFVKGGGSVG